MNSAEKYKLLLCARPLYSCSVPSDGDSLEASIATVVRVLEEMGIPDVSPDAVIAAPAFYDGPVLLGEPGSFGRFAVQLALRLRFVGYALEDIAFLTIRQLCEMYVRDSFPATPTEPLADDRYGFDAASWSRGPDGDAREFSVCFVLGAPRSGTTLLRVMLNAHPGLWAPGELHLANFPTMRDRAHHVAPALRYMPIPEAAARSDQSIAAFSQEFRRWELEAAPVTDVFQRLHDAQPDVMIVDKSPPYCTQLRVLERIGEKFPNARFIHIVRSPQDVVRSYVRMQLHRGNRAMFEPDRNPHQMGEAIWHACNANTEAFLEGIPADRRCTVRYEDLVAEPAPSLRRLCELLGRAFDPRMVDPYAAASGPIAIGAGDPYVNVRGSVQYREPGEAYYPLGNRCRELADRYGY